jgi:hypothetical protein
VDLDGLFESVVELGSAFAALRRVGEFDNNEGASQRGESEERPKQ